MMHSGYLQCWCRKQSLAADIPALVHGLSDMLLEGRTCWWYQLDVVLPSKQLAACLVDIR